MLRYQIIDSCIAEEVGLDVGDRAHQKSVSSSKKRQTVIDEVQQSCLAGNRDADEYHGAVLVADRAIGGDW